MNAFLFNIDYINKYLTSKIKTILTKDILHYKGNDISKYSNLKIKLDTTKIPSLFNDSEYKHIILKYVYNSCINEIMCKTISLVDEVDNCNYIEPSDIRKSCLVGALVKNTICDNHKAIIYDDIYLTVYDNIHNSIILSNRLPYNSEFILLFDTLSLDIKFNSFTLCDNEVIFDVYYYFNFGGLEIKKVFINE